jgi:ubiquinone/menaquinone biosynthesis C-methylase UbiE
MRELSERAQRQGALWGKRAREWAEIQERIELPLWDAALDALEIGAGSRILDGGCGTGGALIAAIARGAVPCGFDPSVNMLTIARERLSTADLRIGELESIPWPNGEFDSAMSINSLQFAQNPQMGVHEMGRVCREGGRVLVAVWDDVHTCDLGRVYQAIVHLYAEPPRGRGVFALSSPGQLEKLFDAVPDLNLERIDTVECRSEYASLEDAITGQMAAGATQRPVEIFGEQAVRDAVHKALEPLVSDEGRVAMRNCCRVAVARKPVTG